MKITFFLATHISFSEKELFFAEVFEFWSSFTFCILFVKASFFLAPKHFFVQEDFEEKTFFLVIHLFVHFFKAMPFVPKHFFCWNWFWFFSKKVFSQSRVIPKSIVLPCFWKLHSLLPAKFSSFWVYTLQEIVFLFLC